MPVLHNFYLPVCDYMTVQKPVLRLAHCSCVGLRITAREASSL